MISPIVDHPYRATIKEAGITIYQVARYIGYSYNRTWEILSGKIPVPQKAKAKLDDLMAEISTGAQA